MMQQNFAIKQNPPGFGEGLKESWDFGSTLRGSLGINDRSSFERELKNAGVEKMNFHLWLSGDYILPAVQASWLGWQGKSLY